MGMRGLRNKRTKLVMQRLKLYIRVDYDILILFFYNINSKRWIKIFVKEILK